MLRWFLKFIAGFLSIIGLAVLLAMYFATGNLASPAPLISTSLTERGEELNFTQREKEELEQQLELKKRALENQALRLASQEKKLEQLKSELDTRIELELNKIADKYQLKIDQKQEELEQTYLLLQEEKEEEYQERMLVKKEYYQGLLDELANRLAEEMSLDLREYQEKLNQENYAEIFNLNLKMKVLELTDQERNNYKERLEKLEEEQEAALQLRETELKQKMQEQLQAVETKYQQEYLALQQQLKAQLTEELQQKKAKDEEVLTLYLAEQQRLMYLEMEAKQQELLSLKEPELKRLEKLIAEMQADYYLLQAELAKLEREVME